MQIQYKSVSVGGVSAVKDEGKGVVTAYVSVTGLKDNVDDVIEPGAYKDTLGRRKPKGVWSHDWKTPTAKTLAADELPPGHKDLPTELADGKPWPKGAGALRIKMKFNLKTQRGREAHSDVLFFGPDQEWSIGYSVPKGGAETKNGVRYIKKLDLFEYSPVLWGAMTHARTAGSVKEAQLAYKAANAAMRGEVIDMEKFNADMEEFRKSYEVDFEFKDADGADQDGEEFEGDFDEEDVDAEESDESEEEDEEFEDEYEEVDEPKGLNPKMIRATITYLEKILAEVDGEEEKSDEDIAAGVVAFVESKATEHETVMDAVDEVDAELSDDEMESLQDAAKAFDQAVQDGDESAADEAANEILDVVEAGLEAYGDEGKGVDSLRVVARTLLDKREAMVSNAGTAESKSFLPTDSEFKIYIGQDTTRNHGAPMLGDKFAYGRDAQEAFVKSLDDYTLGELADHLGTVPGQKRLKRYVEEALTGDFEEKADFSAEELDKLGKKGQAFKNANGEWSYPTPNMEFLDKAIQAWGRSMPADRDGLKRYLSKRAKALNAGQDFMDRINNLQAGTSSNKEDGSFVIDAKELAELEEMKSFAELAEGL